MLIARLRFFITQCTVAQYRCKWEYFSLLFKIEFSIVEAESHFAQLSLAQNLNLHRSFPLVVVVVLSIFVHFFAAAAVIVSKYHDHTHAHTLQQIFTHYHNSQIVWCSHGCKVSQKRCSRLKTLTH